MGYQVHGFTATTGQHEPAVRALAGLSRGRRFILFSCPGNFVLDNPALQRTAGHAKQLGGLALKRFKTGIWGRG